MVIKRMASTVAGMFGVLLYQGVPFALTLEREWKNNQKNISCIPPGGYKCQRIKSHKFGDTFEVMDVLGRSHILFHKGNLQDDSHGCILIGEQYGNLYGKPGVLASRKGFSEFMNKLKNVDSFQLTIMEEVNK
ncbi:hypothetical protein J7M07_01725 [bacterium]|nr:hypothetical protein [bacterium]